jgi:hypothetical protein
MQINVTFVHNVPLKNGGEVIVFVGVTVCIEVLTDAGTTDGLVNGMTIPFGYDNLASRLKLAVMTTLS